MSHSEHLVLTVSLVLNGRWLGNSLVRQFHDSSRRLGLSMLVLFGLAVMGFILMWVLPSSNILANAPVVIGPVTGGAVGTILGPWGKMYPAPWGEGPRRKKTRVR